MYKRSAAVAFVFFLTFITTLPVFAQDKPRAEDPVKEESFSVAKPDSPEIDQKKVAEEFAKEVQEEVVAESSGAQLVTAIEVKGNRAISTNTVLSKLKTKVGSPYRENVVSDDLKRLYLLGYFSDVKIDNEKYNNGVKVIITVMERPLIEKITFSGMMRLVKKEEKLKEEIKSKEGQYLDYPTLANDVRTLKKMYEKIGYNQAAIDYKVDINKENNKASVEFAVKEGKRVTIKNIFIEGNQAFSSTRVLRLMKTKRGWLFNAGILKDDVLKEDVERIKAFYRNNGYSDVEASFEVSTDQAKPYWLYITMKINEGKKYLVGDIVINGTRDVSEKVLLGKLKTCTPGKVFSQDGLRQDIAAMQGVYFDRGYIAAHVEESTYLNPQTGRIDITYSVTENQVMYVDKIKIKGNVKTKDVVVRRELRIQPGDKFDGDKLRRSKERLQNLGFFDEISYDTEETTEADKKNLLVDVKEAKTGSFSFGGGYSTVDQFVGFAEIEQKNFDWKNFPYFTGGGQNLTLRASFGSVSDGYNLSFTEPWLFDYPVAFGFDAYRRSHTRDTDAGYGYDEDVTGGDLRLGKEISEYTRLDLTYRYDKIKISNVSDDASEDLKREIGSNVISSIAPVFQFDSRDNVFYATRGNLLVNSFEWAGGAFGGDKNFWKYFGRFSHYFPMPRNSVVEVRGRAGLASTTGGTERIPIYDRFFAGGASTVRGYDERRLGPVDPVSNDPLGGNALLIGNIEYTYPLLDFIKLAAFYDIGNVWEKIADIGSSKEANDVAHTGGLKSALGLGVRLKTPIGPIMLDYGIPLNKEPGEENRKSGKFHFSVSHGF